MSDSAASCRSLFNDDLAMPKFVRIHDGHGLDRLRLDELPIPEPAKAEVRIKVEAFALNFGDFGLMEGDYPFTVRAGVDGQERSTTSVFDDELHGESRLSSSWRQLCAGRLGPW